ncbi:MAG: hypothetical protein ISR72_12025 [Methylobacter sp.]|nr:hypothetical protein [Methylobacter sp.]
MSRYDKVAVLAQLCTFFKFDVVGFCRFKLSETLHIGTVNTRSGAESNP